MNKGQAPIVVAKFKMTHLFTGTSRLAKLADTLPPRARVGLAVLGGELALTQLNSSPKAAKGRAALELARRWYDGEPVAPDSIEEALYDDQGEGPLVYEQLAQSEHERSAWLALATVLYCAADQAYRETGEMPGPHVSEVRGDEFDYLDEQLRALSPRFIDVLIKVAADLKHEPNLPFEILKRRASLAR